jgi:hypothetical protein
MGAQVVRPSESENTMRGYKRVTPSEALYVRIIATEAATFNHGIVCMMEFWWA